MSNDFNPYAAPSTPGGFGPPEPIGSGSIVPTIADAGSVINYAWDVWKANLGFLVGITVVVFALNIGVSFVQGIVGAIFERQEGLLAILNLTLSLISYLIQTFIGIGQAQIILKLLRGQPAQFGDLFSGGPWFFPILGATIIAALAAGLGFALCIVPGIILSLFFWPFYFLIVDQKTTALESFGVARTFAQPNAGTTFVLWAASVGIMIVGFLALCVGVLFAAPLVSLIWGTAYLQMSGQLAARPQYQ